MPQFGARALRWLESGATYPSIFISQDLLQWMPDLLYRLPHGLIPLFALLILAWHKPHRSTPSIPTHHPLADIAVPLRQKL